jgi:hypothetical protein
VARWLLDIATQRGDAVFELVDIAEFTLAHLDEPVPAARGHYSQPHTRAWSARRVPAAPVHHGGEQAGGAVYVFRSHQRIGI